METTKSFPVDEVSEIQIKSDLSQVNIVSGSSEDIVVRWTDTKRRTTQAVQIGKVLSIKDRGAVALYGVIGLIQLKADKELTVELPSNFSGYIQIESKDESIRVVGVEAPCALRAKTTAGGIDILASSIQSYDLTTLSGAVSLRSVTSEKGIRATTNNGSVEILCREDASAYLLDCRSEHGTCSLPDTVYRNKARQKILCKRRQAVVKETGANQRISRAGHNPA